MIRIAWLLALTWVAAGCQSQGISIKQMSAGDAGAYFSTEPDRELVKAACQGNRDRVKSAIELGADPNAAGRDNFSPLAAMLGCHSISGIGLLVEVGANPNRLIDDSYTLVAIAASWRDSRMLEALLKAGADPNVNSRGSFDHIWQAVDAHTETGSWKNLDLLVQYGFDLDRYNSGGQDRFKSTKLFLLAHSLEICKTLEYVNERPRVNEGRLAIGVEGIRLKDGTEQFRCQQELIRIVKDRMGVEAFEKYKHDFETRPELTGKARP